MPSNTELNAELPPAEKPTTPLDWRSLVVQVVNTLLLFLVTLLTQAKQDETKEQVKEEVRKSKGK